MKRRTLLTTATALGLIASAGIAAAEVVKIGVLPRCQAHRRQMGLKWSMARKWPLMS